MTIKVGQIYRVFYNAGNPNNRRLHVRALVDFRVVVCTWHRRRQDWVYDVVPESFFADQIKDGTYKLAGKDKIGQAQEGWQE